jgi:hypothetical protein
MNHSHSLTSVAGLAYIFLEDSGLRQDHKMACLHYN